MSSTVTTTKNNARLSWLAIASLLLEVLPLIFITLVLVCPAPFQSNTLSLIVVAPNTASLNGTSLSSTNLTVSAAANANATSAASLNGTSISTASSARLPTTTTTPITTTASNVTASPGNNTASAPSPDAAAAAAAAASNASISQPLPTIAAIRKREYPSAIQIMPTKQLEKLPANSTRLANTTSDSSAVVSGSSIRLRIGPLGSCFRDDSGRETCTSSKLQSVYDFDDFTRANITSIDLPSGMTTFPLVLLILIVTLLVKVLFDLGLAFLPAAVIPATLSSTTKSTRIHTLANWLLGAVAVVLAISTGIERNKMSTSADAFNLSNQTRLMDSLPLVAQTGSSFGFIWIAASLLAVNFFLQRFIVKRNIAQAQMHLTTSSDLPPQQPLPQYAPAQDVKKMPSFATSSSTTAATNDRGATHRASVMDLLRNLLPSTTTATKTSAARRAASPRHNSTNDIAMSALVLDEYIRRHYRGDHDKGGGDDGLLHNVPPTAAHHNMFAAYASDNKTTNRMQAKESPPFHAYQADLESNGGGGSGGGYFARHHRGRMSEDHEEEEARSKMASPAPSYWTDRGQDSQYRREKERIYMAELRRQRTMESS